MSTDDHVHLDSSDEADEFITATNSYHPLSWLARWVQGPAQERDGVIEAELAVRILDVMVGEQLVDLFRLLVIAQVKCLPIISFGQM